MSWVFEQWGNKRQIIHRDKKGRFAREKNSLVNKGKILSEEQKRNISKACKESWVDNEKRRNCMVELISERKKDSNGRVI